METTTNAAVEESARELGEVAARVSAISIGTSQASERVARVCARASGVTSRNSASMA